MNYVEKSVLGQNGVEFRDKCIETPNSCKTQELRTLYALYLFATKNIEISVLICL